MKNANGVRRVAILMVLWGLIFARLAGQSPVHVWEEPLTLPTYVVGAPDHNPRFYAGRAYQGAQGRVYPYAMIDSLSDDRQEVAYKAVYLENEYIKVCVLPEIGGRVLSAVDKTNNYDIFYHQHVIKPALIGMIGAWISGGIEWNFPHHHRPSVFMPIDYTFEENPDGSATVWIGEMEIRHRMRWIIGLTVYPGKSLLEATLKPINRTPLVQSFLFFANAGTHANDNYQVFFPPGTEYATYHGKNQFAGWPISHEVYNRIDYTQGVDVSWWKNHPEWTSMFAWNYKDDFFAGYDHGKKAGTVSVANHYIAPGKKFWEWSAGPRGILWDHILTEADGPELELMTGAYSDNQPDYSWLQPLESKIAKIYWFPIRELGGLKFASLEGAVNLEVTEGRKAKIALNTVAQHENTTVRLQSQNRILFEEQTLISPAQPLVREIQLPEGFHEADLEVSLFSSSGRKLLSYKPEKREGEPMPDPVEPPQAPDQIKTVEELYLTGVRLEQFFNPALDPEPYYQEALRRDPGNTRVNTALGIRYLKRGVFDEAEKCFRAAISRATRNYTSPRDGEALYYLGLVLRFQGRDNEAYQYLYKATWSLAFHTAAYYQLAEIAAGRDDYEAALDHVDRAISTNNWSARARNLKSALLRRLGRPRQSLELVREVLEEDPLSFWARHELYLAAKDLGSEGAGDHLAELKKLMRGEVQSYLELSVDYAHGGFWPEAIDVLSMLTDPTAAKPTTFPMVYYYLGHFQDQIGSTKEASRLFNRAAQMPPRYTFPFRLESIAVLREASERNPADARAPYYLGNLLYDHQPEAAVREWERSRSLDDGFATVHRNLAIGYEQVQNDVSAAIASMERAIQCDSSDPRLYYELDVLYEKGGVSPDRRLAVLENNRQTVEKRDDAFSRIVLLYVQTGRYDEAIEILGKHHFNVWEGSRGLRDAYVNAHLLRGLERFQARQYVSALADYQKALEFPLNLESAWPYRGGRTSELFYFIATGHEALGQEQKAAEFYQKSAEAKQEDEWSDLRYYQALAWRKLGKTERAEELIQGLMDFASVEVESGIGFFSKFGEREPLNVRQARNHYLRGLVYRARNMGEEAKSEFQRSLSLDVNHLWARVQLQQLGE